MPRIVLVVDDSMLIRHSVCRFLEQRGFIAESATNGLEALDILARITPDLIITDLSMPKMDGAELIHEIESRPQLAGTPIMVLAAKRSTSELGQVPPADMVIYKDIDLEDQLARALDRTFL